MIRTDHVSLKWLMSFKDLEGQLACWLERLQQYEFEVLHRRGQSRKNADGLSRRLCEITGCSYCEKVEKKNVGEYGKTVARAILIGKTLEEWREVQREDPEISLILQTKEIGIHPKRSEIASGNISAQLYWFY